MRGWVRVRLVLCLPAARCASPAPHRPMQHRCIISRQTANQKSRIAVSSSNVNTELPYEIRSLNSAAFQFRS